MAKKQRKPLTLVVDDIEEYREQLLPAMLEGILDCRVLKAATVKDAIRMAAKHSPQSDDPLDLIILDMHLPEDADRVTKIEEDGGNQFLQLVKSLKILQCPIVVFTAYPTFINCVSAAQAGAAAYIPKVRHGDEGGPDALREICEKLLRGDEEVTEVPPTRAWIEKNHEWLTRNFNGKWVAFIPEDIVKEAEAQHMPKQDGVALLVGNSFEAVRAKVVELPSVRMAQPTIIKVLGKRSTLETGKE